MKIGVIGGSGLYDLEGMEKVEEVRVSTPYGDPSDAFMTGRLHGREFVFLSRHGRGHRLSPTSINYRANVYAMRSLGVEWVVSVSACGSMKESLPPGHLVLVDQFIDLTRHRMSTFFDDGIVAHVPMADPVCAVLADQLEKSARSVGANVQRGGTYVCIEGPQFSTRAESRIYRSWGVDVIGMTNMPEAKLAREAGLSYATMALVTDFDCWHEEEEGVNVSQVLETMRSNVQQAKRVLGKLAENFPTNLRSPIPAMLAHGVITDPAKMDTAKREKVALLLPMYGIR